MDQAIPFPCIMIKDRREGRREREGIYTVFFSTLQGGVVLVNFLNVYGPGLAILFVVFVEAAGVFWFYGVDRFSADVEQMLGAKPGIFWRICWTYISPVFLLVRGRRINYCESIHNFFLHCRPSSFSP